MERGAMGQMYDADPNKPGRQCVTCGRTIDWNANVCMYCGHDFRVAPGPPPKQTTSKPLIGGILLILAGVAALAMAVMFIALDPTDFESYGYDPSEYEMSLSEIDEVLGVCGAIGLVMSIVAMIGGLFAVMRKSFAFAIIGGICGIVGFGFVVGAILALVGIILIAMSRSEF